MPTATPTIANAAYGPNPWDRFDYWRNPTRVDVSAQYPVGRNPVIFVRHGGGLTIGDQRHYRTSDYGDPFYFLQWLLGAQPASEPARHWDVCAFTSAQREWATFFEGEELLIRPSYSTFHPAVVRECQRAIASITHQAVELGFDPARRVGWGDSAGASLMALAQLAPPLPGSGASRTWTEAHLEPRTHDSRLRGVVLHQGQYDVRRIDGVDYIDPLQLAGWFGTSPFNSDAFDALPSDVREAASVRRYFERGGDDLRHYPGFFLAGAEQGDHTFPLSEPHDSRQVGDLADAMVAAGLEESTDFGRLVYPPGEMQNTAWPAGPNHSALVVYQAIEGFLAARLLAA